MKTSNISVVLECQVVGLAMALYHGCCIEVKR